MRGGEQGQLARWQPMHDPMPVVPLRRLTCPRMLACGTRRSKVARPRDAEAIGDARETARASRML